MRRAEAAPLLGARGRATTVLVAGGPEVARRLRADPAVARVTSRHAAREDAHELVEEMTALVGILLAIGLGVWARSSSSPA